MLPLLFSLEPHPLQDSLCEKLPADKGKCSQRYFPDGESYLRIETAVDTRSCIILADLSHPDKKYLPLVFLSSTLRELGATSVGLIAPYLGYMRQDRRFIDGEAVTSRIFAHDLSTHIDWLVTIDPHLHRYHSLDEIYSIPNCVVQGAPALANWLTNQDNLFLVGPDAESEQWVAAIAAGCGHPFVIGNKERLGDRNVHVRLPDLGAYQGKMAVIIDDVISSGHTILSCIDALKAAHIKSICCVAVHGIFSDGSDTALMQRGLEQLVTTNTIHHRSNAIDIAPLLLDPVQNCLKKLISNRRP